MKNRKKWIAIVCVVAAILCTINLILAVKDFIAMGQKKESLPTIEELVENLQSQLPLVQEFEKSVITQTGLEVRNDSLIFTYRIKADDSVLDVFRKPSTASVLRDEGLKGMIDDYKSTRLMQMACDKGMVIANKYYDEDGMPVYFLNYSPDDYRPILNN